MAATSSPSPRTLVVVGGGLGGCVLAIMLAKRDPDVTIELYESRTDLRLTPNVSAGRSINLAISVRGLTALDLIGLKEKILASCTPMYSRFIHHAGGGHHTQPYGKADQCIYSLDRRILNETLLTACEELPNIKVFFQHKCTNVSLRKGTEVTFLNTATGQTIVKRPLCVFGNDGAHSAVRAQLQKTYRFSFSQTYIDHGYKELTLPTAANGDYALPPNHLHIWPRGTFMLIGLANPDKSFTLTLFAPLATLEVIKTDADVVEFFNTYFPDVVPFLPGLAANYFKNPLGTLAHFSCSRYHHEDQVVLLGDAAHAMVPFYGQGMNAAFDDCRILVELMDKYDLYTDRARLFEAYSASQVKSGQSIVKLALENYIEMRAHTASRYFYYRSKLEGFLASMGLIVPQYTMIAFTTLNYHDVILRRDRNAVFVSRVIGAIALIVALLLVFVVMKFMNRS